MIALAATRRYAELPDLSPVLARSVTMLGSTGSIGVSTLSVIAHAREVYGADVIAGRSADGAANVDVLIAAGARDPSRRSP